MKIGWLLLLGGGGYLLYKGFQKARAAINLTYSIKKIRYIGSDLSKSEFEIDIGVVNPTNEPIAFEKFFGQLRFKGSLLVSVIKDGLGAGIIIKPANETTIKIPVYINHLSTALAIKEVIEKIVNKGNVEGLEMQGTLYAGGGLAVPISQGLSLNFSNTGSITGTGCRSCISGIDDDTPIMTDVLADEAILEAIHDNTELRGIPAKYKLAIKELLLPTMVNRAELHYCNNADFRKKIKARANKGRDYLSAIIKHWTAAELNKSYLLFDVVKILSAGKKNEPNIGSVLN